MTGAPARRLGVRAVLVVIHVVMGVALLVPVWLVLGARGFVAYLPSPGVILPVAVPLWILIMGARLFGNVTLGVLRALRWTHAIALGYAAMLAVSGAVMLRAAERGGGLLGGIGLLPLTFAVVLGVLALLALWLVRVLGRAA